MPKLTDKEKLDICVNFINSLSKSNLQQMMYDIERTDCRCDSDFYAIPTGMIDIITDKAWHVLVDITD